MVPVCREDTAANNKQAARAAHDCHTERSMRLHIPRLGSAVERKTLRASPECDVMSTRLETQTVQLTERQHARAHNVTGAKAVVPASASNAGGNSEEEGRLSTFLNSRFFDGCQRRAGGWQPASRCCSAVRPPRKSDESHSSRKDLRCKCNKSPTASARSLPETRRRSVGHRLQQCLQWPWLAQLG
jgi:hypothetical protein